MKGNFVDEQGNHTELVEILCGRAVRVLTALMLTHVVVGLEELEVRARVRIEEGVFIRKFELNSCARKK